MADNSHSESMRYLTTSVSARGLHPPKDHSNGHVRNMESLGESFSPRQIPVSSAYHVRPTSFERTSVSGSIPDPYAQQQHEAWKNSQANRNHNSYGLKSELLPPSQSDRITNESSEQRFFLESSRMRPNHSAQMVSGLSSDIRMNPSPKVNYVVENPYRCDYSSSVDSSSPDLVCPDAQFTNGFNQYSHNSSYASHSTSNEGMPYEHPIPEIHQPPSADICFDGIDFDSNIRASVSPLDASSHHSLPMGFETASSTSASVSSPFRDNTLSSISTSPLSSIQPSSSHVSKVFEHPITPESAEPSPFEYLQNESDLSDLAQHIVENYHSTGTVSVEPEYFHVDEPNVDASSMNFPCDTQPKSDFSNPMYFKTESPIPAKSSPQVFNGFNDRDGFPIPQKSATPLNYSNSVSTRSPLRCNSSLNSPSIISTKSEPVFTPPASPFETNQYAPFVSSSSSPALTSQASSFINLHPPQSSDGEMSNRERQCLNTSYSSSISNGSISPGSSGFCQSQSSEQNSLLKNRDNRNSYETSFLQSTIMENMSPCTSGKNKRSKTRTGSMSEIPKSPELNDLGQIPRVSSEIGKSNRARRHSSARKFSDSYENVSRSRRKTQSSQSQYEVTSPNTNSSDSGGDRGDKTIPVIRIRKKSSISESDSSCSNLNGELEATLARSNLQLGHPNETNIAHSGSLTVGSGNKRPGRSYSPRVNRQLSNSYSSGPKICGVCGDVAKSMHFGGMACDSCKAFFRRSVQGKSYGEFKCAADQQCVISKTNRKNCQFCRFAKCRSNGMEISWVMTETERIALWKSRLSKHRKPLSGPRRPRHSKNSHSDSDCSVNEESRNHESSDGACTSPSRSMQSLRTINDDDIEEQEEDEPDHKNSPQESLPEKSHDTLDVRGMNDFRLLPPTGIVGCSVTEFSPDHPLSAEDMVTINNLIALQDAVFVADPFPKSCYGDSVDTLANVFIILCKKIGTFFHRVDDFHSLRRDDQMILLKVGIGMTLYLHGAYNFDGETFTWPRKQSKKSLSLPYLTADTVRKFTGIPEVSDILFDFDVEYGPYLHDEGVLVLLSLLAIFQVPGSNEQILEKGTVSDFRDKYINLLVQYLKYRKGEKGVELLPKLLKGLEITRTISEFHSKVDIKPTMSPDEMSIVPSSTSFTNQLEGVCGFVKDTSDSSLTEYSSVFSLKERLQQVGEPSLSLIDIPNNIVDIQFHHPLTNALFGSQNRSDLLLTDALEHIALYKQKLLSLPYELNCLLNYRVPPSEPSGNSSSGSSQTSSDLTKPSHFEGVRSSSMKSKNRKSSKKICIPGLQQSSSPSCSSGSRSATPDLSSNNKKKGIKVLCEMLEYISKCDDPEAIESLQNSLPPHVLKNLAAKLNIE